MLQFADFNGQLWTKMKSLWAVWETIVDFQYTFPYMPLLKATAEEICATCIGIQKKGAALQLLAGLQVMIILVIYEPDSSFLD